MDFFVFSFYPFSANEKGNSDFFEVLFDVETQLDSLLQYVFIDSAVASMESK